MMFKLSFFSHCLLFTSAKREPMGDCGDSKQVGLQGGYDISGNTKNHYHQQQETRKNLVNKIDRHSIWLDLRSYVERRSERQHQSS